MILGNLVPMKVFNTYNTLRRTIGYISARYGHDNEKILPNKIIHIIVETKKKKTKKKMFAKNLNKTSKLLSIHILHFYMYVTG